MQLSSPVDSELYSDSYIARDCFMILMLRIFPEALSSMHYHMKTNTLIGPIKKLAEAYSVDFNLHRLLPDILSLATGIDISLTFISILQASVQNNCSHHFFNQ